MQATNALASNRGNAIETPIPAPAAESNGVATAPPPPTPSASEGIAAHILNRLLRMADNYRTSGDLWQAEEMYRTLMDDHADTPQAEQARKQLLDLCEAYGLNGQLHHARSLYERLL